MKYYNKAIKRDPDDGDTYYNHAEVWLSLGNWANARENLKTARDKGVDIIVAFRNDFESVKNFEEKYGRKLPHDIASMLTKEPPGTAIRSENQPAE